MGFRVVPDGANRIMDGSDHSVSSIAVSQESMASNHPSREA